MNYEANLLAHLRSFRQSEAVRDIRVSSHAIISCVQQDICLRLQHVFCRTQ